MIEATSCGGVVIFRGKILLLYNPLTVVVTVAFVIVCLVLYKQSKKSKA